MRTIVLPPHPGVLSALGLAAAAERIEMMASFHRPLPSLTTRELAAAFAPLVERRHHFEDRKSTRLNSSHGYISYAVFCLKKKKNNNSGHITQEGPIVIHDLAHCRWKHSVRHNLVRLTAKFINKQRDCAATRPSHDLQYVS